MHLPEQYVGVSAGNDLVDPLKRGFEFSSPYKEK